MCDKKSPCSECSDKIDAYRTVCDELKTHCPRLVPSPLWGISLANIASMAPEAAEAICDGCGGIAETIHRYWQGFNRVDRCSACNTFGLVHIDEDWRYCIYSGCSQSSTSMHGEPSSPEDIGVAYLDGVKPLCESCHLAKHLGYAFIIGKYSDALGKLAEVNKISLDRAKELANNTFEIHKRLSEVKRWVIRIGDLPGIDGERKAGIETLLNEMYRKGFYIKSGWLHYSSWDEQPDYRANEETAEVLLEASRLAGSSSLGGLKENLLTVIKNAMEHRNILVLDSELRLFIDLIFKKWPKLFNLLTSNIKKEDLMVRVANINLLGKWMIFTKPSMCPQAFRTIVDMLEERGLAYSGKILSNRDAYIRRDEIPIIIYVPSALAPSMVSDVAKVVDAMRRMLGISKLPKFKPDLFTSEELYYGTSSYKPYIYIYRSNTTL
ncbi:MAG: hypothetical protein ACP5IE_00375 [Infirmifilum sp.]